MLLGVEAPAVNPTTTFPAGSQSSVTPSSALAVDGAPTGRWRMCVAEMSQLGSAMWKVRTRAAQMRARFTVLLLL